MSPLEMRDLERPALDRASAWIRGRTAGLAKQGKRILAVIAYGPLVQRSSLDELDLIEIVDRLERATTEDITDALALDPHVFGRVGLVSISQADFENAIDLRTPLVLSVLQGFKVLVESKGLGLRRKLNQNAA